MTISRKQVSNNYNPNTNDNPEELLIEVTEDDEVIGQVTRKECHNETRRPWHRSIHIFLFNLKGDLYLSQRGKKKDTAPGEWTVSAAGHVNLGESYEEAAKIELEEELGLNIGLKLIDKFAIDYGSEREVVAIFAGVTEKEPTIKEEEVEQIKVFNFESIVKKFKNKQFDLSGGSRDSFLHVIKSGSLKMFREKYVLLT